jgi:hypothetical protein
MSANARVKIILSGDVAIPHAGVNSSFRERQRQSRQFGELNAAALVSMRRVLSDVTANARLAGFVAEEDLSLLSLLLK